MIMRNLIFLFFVLFLYSCSNSGNYVKFTNESNTKIDSITFIGNQKCIPLKIKNLIPNNTTSGVLENCNEKGGDGSYIVKIFINKKEITKGFGYYTNGVMYFDRIEIKYTKNGSILVKENY